MTVFGKSPYILVFARRERGRAFALPIPMLSACIVILDQAVKAWVQRTMFPGMSIPVLSDFFHITFILNPGAAFGILAHQRVLFIIMGIVILLVAAFFYPAVQRQCAWLRYGTALLLGGACGNLIDRMRMGLVVDYFDFRFWPVFNVADIAIVCGVGCILYAILFHLRQGGSHGEGKNFHGR